MSKVYRVWAQCISNVSLDVEANSEEEALNIAAETDGGYFVEDPFGGEWKIVYAEDIDDVEPIYVSNRGG